MCVSVLYVSVWVKASVAHFVACVNPQVHTHQPRGRYGPFTEISEGEAEPE